MDGTRLAVPVYLFLFGALGWGRSTVLYKERANRRLSSPSFPPPPQVTTPIANTSQFQVLSQPQLLKEQRADNCMHSLNLTIANHGLRLGTERDLLQV